MKRFIMLIFAAGLVLVGCGQGEINANNKDNEISANTPKQALVNLNLDKGFAEVIEIYETLEISGSRVISVYKGILDDKEDIYVANTEKKDNVWLVTEAINIGLPAVERLDESSLTEKFEAGFTVENATSNEKRRIVEMNNNEIKIWVDVF